MIVASLLFSFMGALVKYTTTRLPATEAAFFRAFSSLLIITPWMIWRKIPLIGKNLFLLFVRGGAGFIALCLSFYVTSKIELGTASVLNQSSTLFVAIFSAFLLKEKVTTPLIVYIVCALIGAALIVKPSLEVINVPALLGLVSGFSAAIVYVSIKQLHKTDSFFTIVFSFSFVSSAASIALFHRAFISPTPTEWTALIGLGLFGTMAQLLMTYSYKYTEASIVSPYSFSGILFSILWGVLFWREIPDIWSILGGLLIVACGIGIMKLKKEKGETAIEYQEDLADLGEDRP